MIKTRKEQAKTFFEGSILYKLGYRLELNDENKVMMSKYKTLDSGELRKFSIVIDRVSRRFHKRTYTMNTDKWTTGNITMEEFTALIEYFEALGYIERRW